MPTTKTIILSAFACVNADCPQFASVELSPADVARLEVIAASNATLGISMAVVAWPASFGVPVEGDDETAFEAENRLVEHYAYITTTQVWWRAEIKHTDYAVETHMVPIATLKAALASGSDPIYVRQGEIDPTLSDDVGKAADALAAIS